MNFISDYSKKFYSSEEYDLMYKKALEAFDTLENRNGKGNDYLGWLDYPTTYDKEELKRIIDAANTINRTSEVLVVIGIGGSYLGSKAVIDALSGYFKNDKLELIFAGTSLSSTYLIELKEYLSDKDFSINVISKSGTTTEPALAYRFLLDLLKKKYMKEELKEHIFYTTDSFKGALHDMGVKEGYEMFSVPSSMGGRYSVFSAVGLLPIAAAGFNIKKILDGAKDAYNDLKDRNSIATKYAAIRNVLYKKGYTTEIFESYEPSLSNLAEWLKQLYGESEGKDNKGIYPTSCIFTRDLHSLGQYIQQGQRNLFETLIKIEEPRRNLDIPYSKENNDGLNYLLDKSLDDVNTAAINGVIKAHNDGGVPINVISIDKLDEYNIGYLLYFFMKSCAISGYTLGVNPFDQPGVEEYKTNMFKNLGKPGY